MVGAGLDEGLEDAGLVTDSSGGEGRAVEGASVSCCFLRFLEPGAFLRECVRFCSVRDLRREVRDERVEGRGESLGMVFVGGTGVEHWVVS